MVHFLYGSKPSREFRDEEEKWFGGKLGGHVGIELNPGQVADFIPSGDFHIFGKKSPKHGRFVLRSADSFWSMFGADKDSARTLTIVIPLNLKSRLQLDSVVAEYLHTSPYDYAFFGMRCAAAAYDLLGKSGLLEERTIHGTCWRYFYPRKLRRKLLKVAEEQGWRIVRSEGTHRRIWDHH
jgi:hypothetical protein